MKKYKNTNPDTIIKYENVAKIAKNLFKQKNAVYGNSWQMMDRHYIADRIMVKCQRISRLLSGKEAKVDEDVVMELSDIINYAIIGLMIDD